MHRAFACLLILMSRAKLDAKADREVDLHGRRVYPGLQAKERSTRLKELDGFFSEAESYAKASAQEVTPAWEAMLPFVKGEIMIHADDHRQIRAAVEWAVHS